MFIQLSDGGECHLHIRYDELPLPRRTPDTAPGPMRRATIIRLHFPTLGEAIEVEAFCHSKDRFIRKEGRFIAGRKLAARLRAWVQAGFMTQRDQRYILRHIFEPETIVRRRAEP